MKNLKKLLAVIVSICVLATFAVPAFAETKTDAQVVTDLGMVQGTTGGVTADYLATTPARYQAAIMFLRLKGLEDEAAAFVPTENFSDLAGLNEANKAILGYLKANPTLGFEGVGDNKFAPLKTITAKEYYKVLLTAMGYKEGTDFTWAEVMPFAASKGLYKLVANTKFTVGDLATGTVEALKATVKGGTDTLLAALVASGAVASDKAVATGFFTAPAQTLEVVSATTDNWKTATFVFNKELDSNTIKKENFSNANVTKDPILLDNKKTVIVVLNAAKGKNGDTEDITIKNVKSTSGLTITEVKKTVTFSDVTKPVITGASAKNAKTIVITGSEPLNLESTIYKSYDDIKIDGAVVRVSSASNDFAKNTTTLNLATLKLAVGAHKIEIAKVTDYANLTADTQTFSFEVAADTAAPAITSAKMNNLGEIEVTFNEDLDKLAAGSFKVNGDDATIKANGVDGAKVTLTLKSNLNIGATVEVVVKYKNQKDAEGNEVKDEQTFSFKVPDDTTLPTVTASIESDNDIILTFSKDCIKAGTAKILDKDGKQIVGVSLVSGLWESASSVKIPAATAKLENYNAENISVKVSDVKDASIRSNGIAETTIALKANDTKEPTVIGTYSVKQGDTDKEDTITFYFSEAMDTDTLKTLANYYVTTPSATYADLKALNAYNDVSISSVASDGKSVTIKANKIADESPTFIVYAMKDLAGNMMSYAVGTNKVTLNGGAKPALTGDHAKATEKNKVEVYFDQTMTAANAGSFILEKSSTANSTVVAYVVDAAIDGSKVTLTLDRNIGTDADAWLHIVNVDGTTNVFGTKMATHAAVDIVDGIKPEITFNATVGGILVDFSETITTTKAGFISELLLTKDGKPVTVTAGAITAVGGTLTGGTKEIKISGLEANVTYKIQMYPRVTIDAGSNPFVATEVKDITAKE